MSAFIGGGLGFLVFAVVFFASPGVLGGDNVKLAVAIGLALGVPDGPYALALGPLLIAVVAAPMLLSHRWTLRSRVPYGPYLAAGAGAVALAVSL